MWKSRSKSQQTEGETGETRRDNIIKALLRTPLLANVRTENLLELLGNNEPITYPAGQELKPPDDSLYILLKGSLVLRKTAARSSPLAASNSSDDGMSITLTAPDALGMFLSEDHPLRRYGVWTHGEETQVLRVKETFWPLFERDPDFQRAVMRHYLRFVKRAPGALVRSTPFGRKANPSSPPPILVLRNGTGKPLPLGGLVELLASSVARQFDEHVRVLHLSQEVKSAGEHKAERKRLSDHHEVHGWVESEWLPLPKSMQALENAIIEASRSSTPETLIEDEVSLVLVDAGDAHFIPTRDGIDLVYLCDESICSPRGLPQELVKAQHKGRPSFEILYTALLPGSGKMANCERTWPLGTVRLRFGSERLRWMEQETRSPCSAVGFAGRSRADAREKKFAETDDAIDRWARAVTGRRVGVALGGGGAYGYVHIALLRALRSKKVPVDMVSGSSFGTLVGAFYVAHAYKGLERIEDDWLLPTLAVSLGLVSNRPGGMLVDLLTGHRRFDELDVPMFPVVADADSGAEWDLRGARIGDGFRASGALPPLAPAIIEDRTYLDGGVVANVPVHVLQDDGAGLVIASNCITNPRLRSRRSGRAWLNMVRETLSRRRLEDLYRMTLLMMRGAGNNQAQRADVVYAPPPSELRQPSQFTQGIAQVARAERSVDLAVAVEKTIALWNGLRRYGSGTVRLTDTGTLKVYPPLRFVPGKRMFRAAGGDTQSKDIPEPLRNFFAHNSSLAFTVVVPASTARIARRRKAALKEQLARAGISPNQISMVWNRTGDVDEVGFRDVRWLSDDLQKQVSEADRELRSVEQLLGMGDLENAWSRACSMGMKLKTRTARQFLRALEPSLRQLLATQGRPVPVPEATVGTQSFYVVWCDNGGLQENGGLRKDAPSRDDRLAIGGDGFVQLWTGLTTGTLRSVDHRLKDDTVAGIAWHPSGRLVCATFKELLVFTLPPESSGLGTPVVNPGGSWERWGVTLSAEGSHALSSTGNRNLVRFPVTEPSQVRSAPGVEFKVTRAVTSPTGRWSAAVTTDGRLLLWEGDLTGEPSTLLESGAECLEWHSSDDVLAVGTRAGVELFDWHGSNHRHTRLETPGLVGQVAWSQGVNGEDGGRLAALGTDVRIWNWATSGSAELVMVLHPEAGLQIGMQWHPGGEYLATWNVRATVWNVRTGRMVARYGGVKAQLAMAAWSPTGRYLALCSRDGAVRIWEPGVVGLLRYSHEDREAGALDFPNAPRLSCAYWHPTAGNCVASASVDGSVRLWNPADKSSGNTWSRLLKPVDGPAITAWSSSGQLLATVQMDELKVWSFPVTGEAMDFTQPNPGPSMVLGAFTPPGSANAVPWLRWSGDQRKLAVCNDREIQVWDVVRAERLWRWRVQLDGAEISGASWSPDGNQLLVTVYCEIHQLVIWSAAKPDTQDERSVCNDGLWDVAVSPDGRWLALGCNENQTMILNAETHEEVKSLPNGLAVHNLAWSPDGKLLALCNTANKVDIYDTETWTSVVSPSTQQPLHEVTELLWRGGGNELPLLLIIATQGGEVLAWGGNSWGWEGMAVLEKANGKEVDCLSLSPDGKHLVISGTEGVARVLPVDPETLLTEVSEMDWDPSSKEAQAPRVRNEEKETEAAA